MSKDFERAESVEEPNTPQKKSDSEIAKTWLNGHHSVVMIIEKKIAEEYGLTDPQYVVLERRREGILIRKLKL